MSPPDERAAPINAKLLKLDVPVTLSSDDEAVHELPCTDRMRLFTVDCTSSPVPAVTVN